VTRSSIPLCRIGEPQKRRDPLSGPDSEPRTRPPIKDTGCVRLSMPRRFCRGSAGGLNGALKATEVDDSLLG